jgi:TfoX/Sxy family transcriptional regulator of competence genes
MTTGRAMPSFDKSPPELVARFAELAELTPEATRKQMFGYPTCVLGGNMFMGLHKESLFLRLSTEDIATFIADEGGEPFEPMPGRPMTGYVIVPESMLANQNALASWIARSYAFAHTLPPKKPKPAKKKP